MPTFRSEKRRRPLSLFVSLLASKWPAGAAEIAKVMASDGAANEQFGPRVAMVMQGDTLLGGVAYVYERHLGGTDNWGERTLLAPLGPEGNPR